MAIPETKFKIDFYPMLIFFLCEKAYYNASFNLKISIPGELHRYIKVVGMNKHTDDIYILDIKDEKVKYFELNYGRNKKDNDENAEEQDLFAGALMSHILDDVVHGKYKYIDEKKS